MKKLLLPFVLFGLLCLGFMGLPAFGAEAAASVAADSSSWWEYALSFDPIVELALKGVLALVGFLFGLRLFKDLAYADLVESLRAGVTETAETMTESLKAAAKDRNLTAEESAQLREQALRLAKEHMWAPAKALALMLGKKYIGQLVQRVYDKYRKDKASPAPASDSPVTA